MVNWVIWLFTSLVQQNICCTTSSATDKIRRIMFDNSIENNYIVTLTGVTRVELLLVTSACAYIRLRTDGPHKRQWVTIGSDSGLLPMRLNMIISIKSAGYSFWKGIVRIAILSSIIQTVVF